jgi:hypothetical protein
MGSAQPIMRMRSVEECPRKTPRGYNGVRPLEFSEGGPGTTYVSSKSTSAPSEKLSSGDSRGPDLEGMYTVVHRIPVIE